MNTLAISNDQNQSFKMKHIDIKFKYVQDQVNKNLISVQFCPTESMVADVFTKSICREKFIKFRRCNKWSKYANSTHSGHGGTKCCTRLNP